MRSCVSFHNSPKYVTGFNCLLKLVWINNIYYQMCEYAWCIFVLATCPKHSNWSQQSTKFTFPNYKSVSRRFCFVNWITHLEWRTPLKLVRLLRIILVRKIINGEKQNDERKYWSQKRIHGKAELKWLENYLHFSTYSDYHLNVPLCFGFVVSHFSIFSLCKSERIGNDKIIARQFWALMGLPQWYQNYPAPEFDRSTQRIMFMFPSHRWVNFSFQFWLHFS